MVIMPNIPDSDEFMRMMKQMNKFKTYKDENDRYYGEAELYETLKDIYLRNGDAKFCFTDTCCFCDKELTDESKKSFMGKDFCDECFEKAKFECRGCCKKFHIKDISITKRNEILCHNCKDKYVNCVSCGNLHLKEDEIIADICKRCFENKYRKCNHCNVFTLKENGIVYHDKNNNQFFTCLNCKDSKHLDIKKCDCCTHFYINNVNTFRFNDGMTRTKKFCSKCFSKNYFTCEDCEFTYNLNYKCNDMDGSHCNKCNPDSHILNYSYKPFKLKFTSTDGEVNPIFLGVEFEIGGCSNSSNIDRLVQIFTNRKLLYFKKDSSIPSYGVEIVSHPATFKAHMNKIPWEGLFGTIQELGITNYNNCGIHCHIGRDKLNSDEISFLDCFINLNFELMEVFCGREFNNYCSHVMKRRTEWGVSDYGRHSAVNISNGSTIELRFCASTNKYEKFVDRLEFIHSLIQFVKAEPHKSNDVYVANDMILKSYIDFCKSNFAFANKYDISNVI